MDDDNFKQLKIALEITPTNGALLALVVKTHLARDEPQDALKLVNRYMSSFGLDPASRGRVNPSAVRQRDMFTDEEDKTGFADL